MKLSDFSKIFLWDVLNPFILSIKKNKKYSLKEGFAGINLGCGIDNPPNWVGLDGGIFHHIIKNYPKYFIKPFFKHFQLANFYSFDDYYEKFSKINLIHHDLLNGIPFKDSTVPNIYSSHFFEHIFKNDAAKLLKECHRVLVPNGTIRICVPSLNIEVERIKNAINDFEDGDIKGIQSYVTSDIVGFNNLFSNHRWMYTVDEMKGLFREAGFKNIKEVSFQEGTIPDLEQLEIRGGVIVEATK